MLKDYEFEWHSYKVLSNLRVQKYLNISSNFHDATQDMTEGTIQSSLDIRRMILQLHTVFNTNIKFDIFYILNIIYGSPCMILY